MWDATCAPRHYAMATGRRPHLKQKEQLFVRRERRTRNILPWTRIPRSYKSQLHNKLRIHLPQESPTFNYPQPPQKLSVAIQAGNDISILDSI